VIQRIAKYEILEKIAEGGFGTVYKARDPFIKRLVAIKTCSVADEEMARRFFREAEIAGRFDSRLQLLSISLYFFKISSCICNCLLLICNFSNSLNSTGPFPYVYCLPTG
jgi:serine/threonine protein kinase